MKKILVIGSLNMDTVIETPYMPQSGETLAGKSIALVPGGKGANQAYTVGKLGGDVSIIGAVADDSIGTALKANLESVGVNTSGISTLPGATTGQAFITVDDNGANSIILIARYQRLGLQGDDRSTPKPDPSLRHRYDAARDRLERRGLRKGSGGIHGENGHHRPCAALPGLPDSFWQGVDYIKPNETELEILAGRPLNCQADLEAAAGEMFSKGVRNVMVSLGGDGCLLMNREGMHFYPAKKVHAVDTTAAGDCFMGAFALALSRGADVAEAITYGQKASAIAVTRKGAQSSIPNPEEIQS